MSRTMLSGLAFAVLIAGVATTPAAADQSRRLDFLIQVSPGSVQDAAGADVGQPDLAARKAKGRVHVTMIRFVKHMDKSSP